MFKFSPKLTFSWPVKVIEPHPDQPGKLVEHEFIGTFEVLSPEESEASALARRAIVAKISAELGDAELEVIQRELDEHDLTTLKRVLRGWEGIVDDKGAVIPFNETTFRTLYPHRRIRNAFTRAYMDGLSEDKARLGN